MSLHVIDQILYSGQQLIKLAFPTVCGLQNPMLSQTLTFDVQRGEFVQVINSGTSHWICLSTVGCDVDSINVYDCMQRSSEQIGNDAKK